MTAWPRSASQISRRKRSEKFPGEVSARDCAFDRQGGKAVKSYLLHGRQGRRYGAVAFIPYTFLL